MHPRGAGERIRGSVIRTFPLFCASLPFLSSLSLSLSLSLLRFSSSTISVSLSFSPFFHVPPAIRLYTFAHTCTGAHRDFPSPFSLRLSFRALLCARFFWSTYAGRVLEFHFLGSCCSSWSRGEILWWISCRSRPFFADLLRLGI